MKKYILLVPLFVVVSVFGLNLSVVKADTSAPIITSISPSQGSANDTVTIYGTNLSGFHGIEFYTPSGQLGSEIGSSASSSSILEFDSQHVVFFINDVFAANSYHGVNQVRYVTWDGGRSNALNFTLNAPSINAPTITSIAPAQGTSGDTITIYGTNLTGASSVEFYSNGQLSSSMASPSMTAQDQYHITFTISGAFAYNASNGVNQVRVLTPSGRSNALNFTLNAPSINAPTITSIAPENNTPIVAGDMVIVRGINLFGNPFSVDGSYGIPVSQQDSSGTSFSFAVPSNMAIGTHTVQVEQKATGNRGNSLTFTVVDPRTIISQSPIQSTVNQGLSQQNIVSAPIQNQDISSYRQIIEQLMKQVAVLQAQLKMQLGSQLKQCINFSNNLSLGDGEDDNLTGDVKKLQTFLRGKGVYNAKITGYFGKYTKAALVKFQRSASIEQTGELDDATTAKISIDCSQ